MICFVNQRITPNLKTNQILKERSQGRLEIFFLSFDSEFRSFNSKFHLSTPSFREELRSYARMNRFDCKERWCVGYQNENVVGHCWAQYSLFWNRLAICQTISGTISPIDSQTEIGSIWRRFVISERFLRQIKLKGNDKPFDRAGAPYIPCSIYPSSTVIHIGLNIVL